MSKIDSWVTKVPRLKNSKVARFSYKAEAYANDNIEGVDSYDYSRDMNVPLATHTDFDASVLSIGARTSFSSVPKNGLNHFFGRVSYNLNKVIDFLSDLLDDFRVQGVETVSSSVARTLPAYYSGKKLRLVNTHATNSILITFYAGQTFKGSSTVIIPANTILELELIGTTWLHISDFTESPPTPWAQYSGKDIPQLPDNVAGTTYKRDNDWVDTDGWTALGAGNTISQENNTLKVVYSGTGTGLGFQKTGLKPNGLFVVGKIICTVPIVSVRYNTGVTVAGLRLSDSGKTETLFYGVFSTSISNTLIYVNQDDTTTAKTCWLDSLYIGTGAYDRLVFDNSYHYRHLLNNAVVPTPQGLYFNGATSYLRSKEKITLPDVFTFSATVNCALKSADQAFLAQNTYAQPTDRILIYRPPNSNELHVIGTDGTTASIFFNMAGYFAGLDNTDIDLKVEIDFVSKTIKAYRNGIQFGSTVSAPTIIKPSSNNIYFGNDALGGNRLLGYMRNIQLYDTALTDTQRNWLAQGNTPPILYDVTNYETEGYVSIQDADGTNTSEETDVDSNGNRILKLPATIKANVTGNAATVSKANVRVSLRHGNTFFEKTWTDLTSFYGAGIWTDGDNIYYSAGPTQYVLNKTTSTWSTKTWSGLTNLNGERIWTDGENIYYSFGTNHFVLNKLTSTWVAKTWAGLTDFNSLYIWTDGENIYYSFGTNHFVLNKLTSTWVAKTWAGLTDFNSLYIWTDGDNIYYSQGPNQFELNKVTSTWVAKSWSGLTNLNGERIWTDGENIYYSNGTNHFVLNKLTSTWVAKSWSGLTSFDGNNNWTDGDNIYCGNGVTHYVLPATRHNYVDDDKYNSLFGTVTKCNCFTLSDRFVFRNE